MKLYVTTYIDDETSPPGYLATWSGTQAQQKLDAKQAKTEGMRRIETLSVDVPTDKAGLLAWINERGVRP